MSWNWKIDYEKAVMDTVKAYTTKNEISCTILGQNFLKLVGWK